MATAAQVFDVMAQAVGEVGPSLVPKVKGVIKFDVTGAGSWLVDLKNGAGKVGPAADADKADLTITVRLPCYALLRCDAMRCDEALCGRR